MTEHKDWRLIAADMIEARTFLISGRTDPNSPEMHAASFIFDEGIFYLGELGMAECVKMLRETAEKEKNS